MLSPNGWEQALCCANLELWQILLWETRSQSPASPRQESPRYGFNRNHSGHQLDTTEWGRTQTTNSVGISTTQPYVFSPFAH